MALLNKNRNTLYNKRPASQLKKLETGLDRFNSLNLLEQCMTLKNILVLFSCSTGGVTDLQSIGGSKNAGSMSVNMDITTRESAYLEHQTPTGLTIVKIDLMNLKS